jgi:hypothetical protein
MLDAYFPWTKVLATSGDILLKRSMELYCFAWDELEGEQYVKPWLSQSEGSSGGNRQADYYW